MMVLENMYHQPSYLLYDGTGVHVSPTKLYTVLWFWGTYRTNQAIYRIMVLEYMYHQTSYLPYYGTEEHVSPT